MNLNYDMTSLGQFSVGDVIYIHSKIIRSETVIILEIYRSMHGQNARRGSTSITVTVQNTQGQVFAFEATHLQECIKASSLTALILFGKVTYD